MTIVKKGISALRNQGVRKTSVELKKYISRHVRLRRYREGYPFQIGGVDAKVTFSTYREVRTLDYILEAEKTLIEDIVSELEPDDIFWDIGANIGVHACVAGKVANNVLAVEPYPPNVERLRENIRLNDVSATVLPIALSNKSEQDHLSVPSTDTPGDQWPALSTDHDDNEGKTISIDTKRGDDLVSEGHPAPTVIKIDVEGASPKVIEGLEETLSDPFCRVVYVEVHLPSPIEGSRPSVNDFGATSEDIRDQIRQFGFEVSELYRRKADIFLKGTR